MNKLISLLKATMSGGLQLFNYRSKSERSRHAMPLVLGALVWMSMLVSAGAMATGLQQDGNGVALLSLYTLVTSVIILMEGIYKSSDLLFKPKDNDLLLSLPVPRRHIIFTRIAKFYLSEFIYCIIFLSPAIVAYASTFQINPVLYWLTSITILLFAPVIPIALSCVIGLISSSISSRFKRKNLFQVLFSFAFLILMSVFIVSANTTSDFDGRNLIAISDKITKFYYPASTFTNLVSNFNIWQYLLFIAINLAVLVITIFIIGKFYTKVVSQLGTVRQNILTSSNYRFTKHSQTFAMTKKELTKYFNTPVLLVNTMMGLVLFLVVIIALCVKYDDFVGSIISSENFPLTAEQIHSFIPSITFALLAIASFMTYITATSISLEGKTICLLKSLPISNQKILISKVLSALIIMIPVTILGSLIMSIRFQFSLFEAILILIAAIFMPLITELIGILIDLKYARFNAETDAVTVKQSAGVMVATFLGLGIFLFTVSFTIGLVLITGQIPGLLMMDAIFVIVTGFLYLAIITRGEAKLQKLSA